MFGMRWMKQAIPARRRVIPLHDEELAFATGRGASRAGTSRHKDDWLAGLAAYKAMILEGLEVVLVVIALERAAA